MGKRLFIGGLPYTVNDQQLNDIFSKVGTVESANVINDKFTGQSKGFGFVEMASEEDAQKAIKELNETELEGRKLAVNEARPREERPQRSYGGGSGYNRGGGRDNFRGGGDRGDRRRGGGGSNRW